MLFAAGAGSALVAVAVAHSDWPPAARALPRVGDAAALDLERIVALAPDLVVAWPYTAARAARRAARAAAARVHDAIRARSTASPTTSRSSARSRAPAASRRRPPPRCATRLARSARHRTAARAAARLLRDLERSRCTRSAAALISRGDRDVRRRERVRARCRARARGERRGGASRPRRSDRRGHRRCRRRPPWLDDWRRGPRCRPCATATCSRSTRDLLHRPGPRFVDGVAAAVRGARSARTAQVIARVRRLYNGPTCFGRTRFKR